jgi:hypothetical protein
MSMSSSRNEEPPRRGLFYLRPESALIFVEFKDHDLNRAQQPLSAPSTLVSDGRQKSEERSHSHADQRQGGIRGTK